MVASDEILKRVSDQYRRIRNTFRFILGNLSDFNESEKVEFKNQVELDKWIITQVQDLEHDVINYYESYSYHNVVQRLHNFCVNELGGIYLDIVKDRLYTCKQDSIARKSCQTSLDYVLNVMVRLISPILSFTSEEIWQTHESLKNQNESIFLSQYIQDQKEEAQNITNDDWKRIFEIKDLVNQSIESLRNQNKLKGSLDANVRITANTEDKLILDKLGEELHFVFISSKASVEQGKDFAVNIEQIEEEKCSRCWHRDASVGKSKAHPGICSRCEENIVSTGEIRSFV
jgi:isoleucyl-tRNA synthetase